MLDQGLQAILVAAVIAVICFIPYLLYQYRRYGQFSASRLIWMGALLVYGTALLAYTLFPLPSAEWCAKPHDGLLVLDPTVYFRDMWQMHLAGRSWTSIFSSWTVLQMVLNVVLFIPLGILLRNLWKVGVIRATLIGLGISLLIETTQLTGNWFTAPCQYRVADISDLTLNTLGALVGALIAVILPRLVADADSMEAARTHAKPVTRGRRWVGMMFDAAAVALVILAANVALTAAYLVVSGMPSGDRGDAVRYGAITDIVSDVCGLAVIVGFALFGSGASIGQRLVYLKPVPNARFGRLRLLLRAVVVQGAALVLLSWVPDGESWGFLLLLVAVVWVVFRPRGLSYIITGCQLVDAREPRIDQPSIDPDPDT